MTEAQIDLLKRLIDLDRAYHTRRQRGEAVSINERGIEVGWAVDRRTVKSLEDAGLVESLDPGINGHAWVFLGQYDPFNTVGKAVR